jgi:hypothetical protein
MKSKNLTIESLEERLNHGFRQWLVLLTMLGLVFYLWFVLPKQVIEHYDPTHSTINPGTFGDTYGAVNALFAGFAFAGLIWSILQTNHELRLQKKVVLLQLKEQRESKEALDEQSETQKQLGLSLDQLAKATRESAILGSLNSRLIHTQRGSELFAARLESVRSPAAKADLQKQHVEMLEGELKLAKEARDYESMLRNLNDSESTDS